MLASTGLQAEDQSPPWASRSCVDSENEVNVKEEHKSLWPGHLDIQHETERSREKGIYTRISY